MYLPHFYSPIIPSPPPPRALAPSKVDSPLSNRPYFSSPPLPLCALLLFFTLDPSLQTPEMTDWQSPAVLAQNAASFNNLMHALLGLYIWEWATSLDFDWQFVSGKKRVRWPLIFYWAGRYSLLFAMIGIAIALNVKSPIDCQGLYTFNQVFGNGAIGFASLNLAIRTMAIWKQNIYIVVFLVLVSLGQWSLLVHGVLLNATYVPEQGCVITHTNNDVLSSSFIYTMVFDLVVMLLAAYKLVMGVSGVGGIGHGRGRLVNMLFADGLVYFFIAFVANTIATVFMLMNLNPVMSVIFNVPSAIASTIVASRVVRRLSNFMNRDVEQFGNSNPSEGLKFRNRSVVTSMFSKPTTTNSVQVPMETFTVTDATYADPDEERTKVPVSSTFGDSRSDLERGPTDDSKPQHVV